MTHDLTLHFDGACSFNCGPDHPMWLTTRGAWGFVAYGKGGLPLHEAAGVIAPTSSNMAELRACLEALRWAVARGVHVVRLRGDSAFVIRFLQGRNRISRLPHLAHLQYQIATVAACRSVRNLDGTHRLLLATTPDAGRVVVLPQHVARTKNTYADRLCSDALTRS